MLAATSKVTVVLTLAAISAAAAGCSSDSGNTASDAATGAPAAKTTTVTTTTRTTPARVNACESFSRQEPEAERGLVYTRSKTGQVDHDGAMGKLVNKTGAAVWVRPVASLGSKSFWGRNQCTLAAGASVMFSRAGSYYFQFAAEAESDDAPACEYATCIALIDPDYGYPIFMGWYDKSVKEKRDYEVTQKENQVNSFIWGGSKITVKREKDGFYNSAFPDEYIRRSEMSDWATYTVDVESLSQ